MLTSYLSCYMNAMMTYLSSYVVDLLAYCSICLVVALNWPVLTSLSEKAIARKVIHVTGEVER
jgi:hypothetical protein